MYIDNIQKTSDSQDIVLSFKNRATEQPGSAAKEKSEKEQLEKEKREREQAASKERNLDQVVISNEAKELQEQMNQIRESGKAQAEEMEIKSKCMTIAGRVAAGDKVPNKDMQYLMKNDPELYAQAMKLRIPKKNPKDWDSITQDDEEENTSDEKVTGSNENISVAMPQGETEIGVSVS